MGAPKDSSSFTGNEPSVSLNPRAEGGGPGGRARRPGRGADGSSEVKSPDEVQAPVLPGARPRAFVTADGKRAAGFVVLIENLLRLERRAWVPARLPRALRPQAARGGRLPKGGAAVPTPALGFELICSLQSSRGDQRPAPPGGCGPNVTWMAWGGLADSDMGEGLCPEGRGATGVSMSVGRVLSSCPFLTCPVGGAP